MTDIGVTEDCCWKESSPTDLQTGVLLFLSFHASSGMLNTRIKSVQQNILISWHCSTVK